MWWFNVYCCSVTKLCPTLCNTMDCSTLGFPVLHYLLEFAHAHVLESVIPSNHLIFLLPPSPALSLSQHQGLFQWVGSSHQVAKVLEVQLQLSYSNELSRLISFRIDWFDLAVQGTVKESSPAPQFENINSLALSLLYDSTLIPVHDYLKNHTFDYMDLCGQNDVSAF